MKADAEKKVHWRECVTVNPEILLGKPILAGTRISVEHLLEVLASGWSMHEILEAYPHLQRHQVLAAFSFAAEFFREEKARAIQKITR